MTKAEAIQIVSKYVAECESDLRGIPSIRLEAIKRLLQEAKR